MSLVLTIVARKRPIVFALGFIRNDDDDDDDVSARLIEYDIFLYIFDWPSSTMHFLVLLLGVLVSIECQFLLLLFFFLFYNHKRF